MSNNVASISLQNVLQDSTTIPIQIVVFRILVAVLLDTIGIVRGNLVYRILGRVPQEPTMIRIVANA
jgi:hypothetical protein